MTINERLFVSGLLEDFDSSIRTRDRETAITVLNRVDVTREQAAETVEAIFANPTKYGFPV